jgi:hypothetical protein
VRQGVAFGCGGTNDGYIHKADVRPRKLFSFFVVALVVVVVVVVVAISPIFSFRGTPPVLSFRADF